MARMHLPALLFALTGLALSASTGYAAEPIKGSP